MVLRRGHFYYEINSFYTELLRNYIELVINVPTRESFIDGRLWCKKCEEN
jgi:hypothetical protein